MNKETFNNRLFHFIQQSPTSFHTVDVMAKAFQKAGFQSLREQDDWHLSKGEGYYLIRDNGSLICFILGEDDLTTNGFRLLAAHTDSPSLKVKPQPDKTENTYGQLGVEVYGSPLLHPWFDRELSIAGRVSCKMANKSLQTFLIDFERPMGLIPSLAIHLDKEANKSHSVNAQKDLPLLISQPIEDDDHTFYSLVLDQLHSQYPKVEAKKILGADLFCYDCSTPNFFGHNYRFISGPRLDNLLSCFIGMVAMIEKNSSCSSLFICSDHEEIGSTTASGANGSFLSSFFERIINNPSDRHRALSQSFLISLDNAHALHPNSTERSDENHKVLLNNGPVIKTNANMRYATNSISRSIYENIASEVGVVPQDFVMRSDMGCGSTVGPLVASELGVLTIDIGTPTLAMHSVRETTGADDPFATFSTIQQFLNRRANPHCDNY